VYPEILSPHQFMYLDQRSEFATQSASACIVRSANDVSEKVCYAVLCQVVDTRYLTKMNRHQHRRIADEYCGGAKFPTKYFRIELCVERLLCE